MEPITVAINSAGTEALTFADKHACGWAAYHSGDDTSAAPMIWLRFGRQGHTARGTEPLEVREILVAASSGTDLGGQTLREVPFRRIEAAVNMPDVLERLRDVVPSDVVHHVRLGPLEKDASWTIPPTAARGQRAPRLQLKVPTERRKPDSFYEAVAARFLWLSTQSRQPAQDLAEANGVPVTTVHRWVKEARTRGLLASAPRRSKS